MSRSSDVILSYSDSLLRENDIELLKGPCWINDNIIGFYFEYLNMTIVNDYCLTRKVLFVCPEVTQLIKLNFEVTYPVFLNPLKVKQKNFVFFPINDCKSRDQAGGSHWTLLVYSEVEQAFFHFDSAGISNQAEIKEFTKNLSKYFTGNDSAKYIEVQCPQQTNGVDCGLYVLCFADVLLKHISECSKIDNCDFSEVTEHVAEKRESLLKLIKSLIKSYKMTPDYVKENQNEHYIPLN